MPLDLNAFATLAIPDSSPHEQPATPRDLSDRSSITRSTPDWAVQLHRLRDRGDVVVPHPQIISEREPRGAATTAMRPR